MTPVRIAFSLVVLFLMGLAHQIEAEPRRVRLGPPGSEVGFRAYGAGLLPIDVSFTRFDGWLTYDPDDRQSCRVELRVETASLVYPDPALRDTIAGPDFMDTAAFPTLTYVGACERDGLNGILAMHGVSRPFALPLNWMADGIVAEGRLLRADWGMTAMPVLVGRTVRVRVSVPLTGAPKQASHSSSAP